MDKPVNKRTEDEELPPLDVLALAFVQAARLGMTRFTVHKDAGGWHAIRHADGCNPVGRLSYSLTDAILHALGAGYSIKDVQPDLLGEAAAARRQMTQTIKRRTDG